MELTTERLILRPWRGDDAEALFALARDERVGPACGWQPHRDIGESREVLKNILMADGTFAVTLKSGQLIGSLGIVPQTDAKGAAEGDREFGFWLGVPHWGKGYMSEAVRRVIRYLFEETDTGAIWCGYFEGNERSRATQEKNGFVFHHTEKDVAIAATGKSYTIHKNRLTREAWQWEEHVDGLWDEMYRQASAVRCPRDISGRVSAGSVGAAIEAESGRIYTGVCVDTDCSLGICAERNAIFHMITCGENSIRRVLCVMPDGRTGAPCGACRELMTQLMPGRYGRIEVMLDYGERRSATMRYLTPIWWIG